MPSVEFEPTISTEEWPQTYALDRAAVGPDKLKYIKMYFILLFMYCTFHS